MHSNMLDSILTSWIWNLVVVPCVPAKKRTNCHIKLGVNKNHLKPNIPIVSSIFGCKHTIATRFESDHQLGFA